MNNKLLFYFLPQIVEKETGLTSLRIRAEKEKELQEAEAYWSKRFAKQEQEVRITTQVGSPAAQRAKFTKKVHKLPSLGQCH